MRAPVFFRILRVLFSPLGLGLILIGFVLRIVFDLNPLPFGLSCPLARFSSTLFLIFQAGIGGYPSVAVFTTDHLAHLKPPAVLLSPKTQQCRRRSKDRM